MEIQTAATNVAQGRVQEEAAVAVQAMALQNARAAGEDLARIMDAAPPVSDPARGNFLDITA
ncbi:MAG: YjfB family protein [Treponema sp.]|nr:YjfB family protein [Treponema sp.]